MPLEATLSRAAAPIVGQHARRNETRAATAPTAAVVGEVGDHAKCLRPRARAAATKLRCRSSPVGISRCTAQPASSSGAGAAAAATAVAPAADEGATRCTSNHAKARASISSCAASRRAWTNRGFCASTSANATSRATANYRERKLKLLRDGARRGSAGHGLHVLHASALT